MGFTEPVNHFLFVLEAVRLGERVSIPAILWGAINENSAIFIDEDLMSAGAIVYKLPCGPSEPVQLPHN